MTLQDTVTERQSRRELTNPSELMITLRRRHPDETKEAFFARFADMVLINEPCNMVIIREWAALNFGRLTNTARTPADDPAKKAQAAAQRESVTAKAKEAIVARIILLDWKLPNGKPLRECTGKECRAAGGWLIKIAKAVKPTEIVGKVMSEAQVRKAYGADV